jgi:ABC-2 type transport system ATP-binding protein
VLQFQFLEQTDLAKLQHLTSGLPVKWEMDEKGQIFSALTDDVDEVISQIIARVVSVLKVKDVKINETSTEEIIRNIYEKGSA